MHVVRWTGASGRVYECSLHAMGSYFTTVAACYIFTKSNASGKWSAIYVGQTADLSQRLEGHHAMPCIRRHGATHICIYVTGMNNLSARLIVESDLISSAKPVCNH